jgi:hypothetical protein
MIGWCEPTNEFMCASIWMLLPQLVARSMKRVVPGDVDRIVGWGVALPVAGIVAVPWAEFLSRDLEPWGERQDLGGIEPLGLGLYFRRMTS